MLLHLNAPYKAIVVCLGNDNRCVEVFGMPETKGKDLLTQRNERVALIAMAEDLGWDLALDLCPTCALDHHKINLSRAQEAFNTTKDNIEKDALEGQIAVHEAFIADHAPEHEQVKDENQPSLFDGDAPGPDGAEAPAKKEPAEVTT